MWAFVYSEPNGSLKSQDLLASEKHKCWEANIWESLFFWAQTGVWIKSRLSQILNKDEIQVYEAYFQAWSSLFIYFSHLPQQGTLIYVFIKCWVEYSAKAHLNCFKTFPPTRTGSSVNRALACKTGILRTPPCPGIKELLTLDKSLHFSRSEID